ncbi:MAG: hypothetical protein WEB52_01920 [Dehalococcoidia bacterium]
MAFGKKKAKDEEPAAGVLVAPEPALEAGAALDGEMFASSAAAPDDADAPALDEAPADNIAAIEPAPEPAPAADPLAGGPDLLSMFQTTTIEADDKAALLELAGEVEIDDLLEDLQTVKAALGSKR